jgi:hypothetical protein
MDYFIYDGKEQSGPFTFEELKKNRISKNILIWREGLEDWIEAENLSELNNIWDAKTPPIPKVVKKINSNHDSPFYFIKHHILQNRNFYFFYFIYIFLLFTISLFGEPHKGFFPFTSRVFATKEFLVYSLFVLFLFLSTWKIKKHQLIKNNLIFFNIYSFWLLVNFLSLMFSRHTWGVLNYHKLFFPFSGYPEYFYPKERNVFTFLSYSYDYSEFFIYTTLPVFILFIKKLIPETENCVYRETTQNIELKIVSLDNKTIGSKVFVMDKNFNSIAAEDGIYIYKSLTHKLIVKDGIISQRFFLEKVNDIIYEKQGEDPNFEPKLGDKVYFTDWTPVLDGKYNYTEQKYYYVENGIIVK